MYINQEQIINNEFRDEIRKCNLSHGFMDRTPSFDELGKELFGEQCENGEYKSGEFDEAIEELVAGYPVNETREHLNEHGMLKLEGAPTEFADVIIFILDYFSRKGIDVDEAFLTSPDGEFANEEFYKSIREKYTPLEYFEIIHKDCLEKFEFAKLFAAVEDLNEAEAVKVKAAEILSRLYSNNEESLEISNGSSFNVVSRKLHEIIKEVVKYCDIYEVDISRHLVDKFESNKNRPFNYKKGTTARKSKGQDLTDYLKQMGEEKLAEEFMKIKSEPEMVELLKVFEPLGYCPREIIEFELARRIRVAKNDDKNKRIGKRLREFAEIEKEEQ